MSGHVFPFSAHGHDEAQRLLPWLANATLDEEEREWVALHLSSCDECRVELAGLQALRKACAEECNGEAVSFEVDRAWQRMRRRLPDAATRRTGWREGWRIPGFAMPRWIAGALTAQAILLLAFGAVTYWPQRTERTYHTLSSATAGSRGNLVIVFDPQLSEARMRRLLDASDARIVDGPNEAGAYVLAVPAGRIETVRDALRAAPGVVMVESLAAGPAP